MSQQGQINNYKVTQESTNGPVLSYMYNYLSNILLRALKNLTLFFSVWQAFRRYNSYV